MTQADVAAAVLKSVETISNFERGKTLPGLVTVERLASAFGVSVAELFAFDSPAPSASPDFITARVLHRLSQMPPDERALVADLVDVVLRHRVN